MQATKHCTDSHANQSTLAGLHEEGNRHTRKRNDSDWTVDAAVEPAGQVNVLTEEKRNAAGHKHPEEPAEPRSQHRPEKVSFLKGSGGLEDGFLQLEAHVGFKDTPQSAIDGATLVWNH